MAANAILASSVADDVGQGVRRQRRRRAELLDRHWTMLVLSVGVLIAAFLLRINDGGRVGASWLPFESLPPMCGSRALLGIECPGCGLTRSFVALASGDVAGSFRFHRLGWLMFLATASQIPYRIVRLRQLREGNLAVRQWPTWFGSFLIAALIVNWAIGMLGGAM
jgi:hypothetical protein